MKLDLGNLSYKEYIRRMQKMLYGAYLMRNEFQGKEMSFDEYLEKCKKSYNESEVKKDVK